MSRRPARETYQPDHADVRAGAGALAVLLVLGLMGAGAAWAVRASFQAGHPFTPTTPLDRTQLIPQGPRLETDPRADRLALEARARAQIETWGWADQGKGLARIPIERAMQIQAQRGWPAKAPGP